MMSSPTRQVSVRRLPPLPNQVQIKPILKENSTNLEDGLFKSRSRGKFLGEAKN